MFRCLIFVPQDGEDGVGTVPVDGRLVQYGETSTGGHTVAGIPLMFDVVPERIERASNRNSGGVTSRDVRGKRSCCPPPLPLPPTRIANALSD